MNILLAFSSISFCYIFASAQPEFFPDELAGPPPWGGGRGPWRGRPWHGRHRHRHWRGRHRHRHPFPPPFFDPEPFMPPPPLEPLPPPPPRPIHFDPPPPPQRNRYSASVEQLISEVDRYSSAFQGTGRSYSDVLAVMSQMNTRRSGVQYDVNNMHVSPSAQFELSANKRTIGAFYETDLVLSIEQIRRISGSNRSKRKVSTDTTKRWSSQQIPYKFAINDASWQNRIRTTLKNFEINTCFRLIENGNGNDYIIFNKGQGCYSSVGKLGGAQEVSIGYGCETPGVISHEVLHAIGLWHEQSRTDRDSYVRVLHSNIEKGSESQFDKMSTSEANTYGIAYDYGSVMHYGAKAYAKSFSSNTIEPLDARYLNTIGSRTEPSFLDFKAVNKAFCSRSCSTRLPCQNNGYVNPNACHKCICPTGFGGQYCEHLQYSACGRSLISTSRWQTLSYSGSSTCYWKISSPVGTKIRFELTTVYFKCAPICEEFVEVKYRTPFDRTGFRLCCKPEYGQLVSSGNDIIIITKATAQSNFVLKYITEGTPPRATTRQRAPVTTRPSVGTWSSWSAWSSCSELCGACGTRRRSRSCIKGVCRGTSAQRQVCNQNACKRGTTLSSSRGKRSVIEMEKVRVKRADSWCCAGFRLVQGNYCNRVHSYKGK